MARASSMSPIVSQNGMWMPRYASRMPGISMTAKSEIAPSDSWSGIRHRLTMTGAVALLMLSMVATLFGPRLLYRFLQDWVTQVTIGFFMGTLSMSASALRPIGLCRWCSACAIRSSDTDLMNF
jgi:hypothetical protein